VALKPAQLNLINFYVRKTGHLLAYGLMYFLWFRALRQHADYGPRRAFLWALGLCLFFASMDEGRQGFYSARGSSIHDVILDMSGAGLAALITGAVWRPRYLVAPLPMVSWWRRPHRIHYWLIPILWSMVVLVVPGRVISIKSTLGPLKWWVSWFAIVDSYELRTLNAYLWKAGQILAVGILYVLWFRAFQRYAGASRRRSCLYAVGVCLLVAMMSQGLQTFPMSRGDVMYDVILDMCGAGLAALITGAVWRHRAPALPSPAIGGGRSLGPE
jgi:VanZ family protein